LPKIGVYDYPIISLDEAISYLKILKDNCGGDAKRETFSQEIVKKGGWFNMIVGSMNDYGLVETGGGRISIGSLGKRILFNINENDIREAKVEAAKRYRLFSELSERFPKGATLEQFQIYLRDVGNVDLEIVKKESSKVYKVYSDTSKYLISAEPSITIKGKGKEGQEAKIMPEGYIDVSLDGKSFLSFPLDDEGLEMLRPYFTESFLKFLKSRVKERLGQ